LVVQDRPTIIDSLTDNDLLQAAKALSGLGVGSELRDRIRALERSLEGTQRRAAERAITRAKIDDDVLQGALTIKQLAGQVNVIVHVVGILVSIPHILQRDERIESLSLGAGNYGRDHDLVTDRRVAEFKFIEWRGGAETIRQNVLFIDLFNLASLDTPKRRYMYLVGREHPDRFLKSKRAITSVLSRNASAAARFAALHGEQFKTVADYAESIEGQVELVDLREVVPAFARTM
jgi:hypothetical protein